MQFTERVMVNETCPACNGGGIQTDANGLRVRCPVCFGSGRWQKEYMLEEYIEFWIKKVNFCPICKREIVKEVNN